MHPVTKYSRQLKPGEFLSITKRFRPIIKFVHRIISLYILKNRRTDEEIIPEKIPLNIVYEDDDVMIINKPAGLVVHPASGNYTGTLINGVAYYLQQKNKDINEETLAAFWTCTPHR